MITAAPHLNADQLRAVEHSGGPLLVLAGPRTGKTGVLVERISHLVANQGVSPERILALTFSRRAVDEMRARVTARLPEAEKVEARAFHSFALSIVRRHAGSLGLRSAPEIVPTSEQWTLVSDILGDEDPASWGAFLGSSPSARRCVGVARRPLARRHSRMKDDVHQVRRETISGFAHPIRWIGAREKSP